MNKEQILDKLKSGEIKIYEIEKHIDPSQSIQVRREYIQSLTNLDFLNSAKVNFDPDQVYGSNCENVIGQTSLPVGIAGPMKINGDFAKGSFYVPMATTEGALIASVNRGAKIISEAGGVSSITKYNGITRAPVFRTRGIKESRKFINYVEENIQVIKDLVSQTDRFIKLVDLDSYINGRSVWIRFTFDTDQAMGMNMAVKATKSVSEYLMDNTDAELVALSGNLCTDKKSAAVNTILGRGREVNSEVRIGEDLVRKYLKCEIDQVVETNRRKTWQGSALAGSTGFNAHTANMVAAIYIATGQDPAHVVDASNSITTAEKDGNELYFSVRIPNLNIASIGGGTGLQTQNEMLNLSLKNIDDKNWEPINRVGAFSEVIATAVLAGELSLHAAFAARNFAKAHQDLGRAAKLQK